MKPKKISPEETVYQSSLLSIKSADLTLADGTKVKWEYGIGRSGVVIIPVNSREEVILVKEWRLAYKKDVLQLPAGACDSFDQRKLVDQAQHELQVETGFSSGHLLHLGRTFATASMHAISNYYLATQLKRVKSKPEHGEIIQTVTMPIRQAYQHFRKQEDSTSYSTVGLVWAMEALELISFNEKK